MIAKQLFDENTTEYLSKIENRMGTFGMATMSLKKSFIDDGDSITVAKQKVTDLNDEISVIGTEVIMSYWTGNVQPLIDAVNASVLAHMTADSGAKKTLVTDILSRV